MHLWTIRQCGVDGCSLRNLRQIVELKFVGDYRLLLARKIKQFRQNVGRRMRQRLGVNQFLPLILQLNLGASGVDRQTNSCLLQVRCLLVKAIRKGDADFRGVVNGKRAENKDVLSYYRRGDIFTTKVLSRTCFANPFPRDLIASK